MFSVQVLVFLWLAWAASWAMAARWSSTPIQVESTRAGLPYRLLILAGGFLIACPWQMLGVAPIWHLQGWQYWLLDLIALSGFAFCWWARLHLGRLWSSSVTIKPDHRIVDSGPYGLVRHPIYTGLLVAIIASALTNATLPAIAGFLLLVAGLLAKIRLEETALRGELGAPAYDSYARRVPMLVPWRLKRA